jgi:prepilin-type N-terminal cleavage/methylation domain-containing protein
MRPGKRGGKRGKAGFTLVEIASAVVIIGVVAAIGAPMLRGTLAKTKASSIAADLRVVQLALHNHQADRYTWPADAFTGVAPMSLRSYLPPGFSFRTEDYTLDYDDWVGRWPSTGKHNTVVTIYVKNRAVQQELERILSKGSWPEGEPEFKVRKEEPMAY